MILALLIYNAKEVSLSLHNNLFIFLGIIWFFAITIFVFGGYLRTLTYEKPTVQHIFAEYKI